MVACCEVAVYIYEQCVCSAAQRTSCLAYYSLSVALSVGPVAHSSRYSLFTPARALACRACSASAVRYPLEAERRRGRRRMVSGGFCDDVGAGTSRAL